MGELIGTTLAGKYRIIRLLGEGGMGAVYEGEHCEIGMRVAVKVIAPRHTKSATFTKRFKQEARASSAAKSEHIVQVYDVGEDPTVGLYMVMEMLEGEDLASLLRLHRGRLPITEAVTIVVQAARGLAKAHAAGVVHRDLKPENLFVTQRDDGSTCVKILDFGVSKLTTERDDGDPPSSVTGPGIVVGTPLYMSPEQARGLEVDARSDVWSLGAVLYEALAGQTAFPWRDSYEQMIIQTVTERPAPLHEIAPHVPAELADIVHEALEYDVHKRTRSAAVLARELALATQMSSPSLADLVVGAVPPLSDHFTVTAAAAPAYARRSDPVAARRPRRFDPDTLPDARVPADRSSVSPISSESPLPKRRRSGPSFVAAPVAALALLAVLALPALRERPVTPVIANAPPAAVTLPAPPVSALPAAASTRAAASPAVAKPAAAPAASPPAPVRRAAPTRASQPLDATPPAAPAHAPEPLDAPTTAAARKVPAPAPAPSLAPAASASGPAAADVPPPASAGKPAAGKSRRHRRPPAGELELDTRDPW